jgi:CheY-like chemotaxis protein
LYADDNPINQRVAGEMLRKAGHRVDIAASGAEAVTAMDDGPYDVVLMDVQMPDFDGCNATAAIRARERHTGAHTPILGVTAYSAPADEVRCLEAGMDAYVPAISGRACCRRCGNWRSGTNVERRVVGDEIARSPSSARHRRAASHRYHHLANFAARSAPATCARRAAGAPVGAVGLFHAAHAYDAADRLSRPPRPVTSPRRRPSGNGSAGNWSG